MDHQAERLLETFAPLEYPTRMRDAGIEGQVVLACIIDTTGRVDSASVHVVSATHQAFMSPSVAVVLSGRYTPAMRAGRRVRICIATPIRFVIEW